MRKNRLRREGGFNLVELMVVVAIIGILTSVAVPKFSAFKARAMQTEAKSGLNGLFLAVQAYQSNYNAFPVTSGEINPLAKSAEPQIGFTLTGNKRKYDYGFLGRAEGWVGGASSKTKIANNKYDHWRINTNKWLCNAYDAVSEQAATQEQDKQEATADNGCPQKAQGTSSSFNLQYIEATDSQ